MENPMASDFQDSTRYSSLVAHHYSEGLHVAIIMDGSGRWALARGLERADGHRAGTTAVRRIVEAAPGLGVSTLTLFAFSQDNWQRPAREVAGLMEVFEGYLNSLAEVAPSRGIRVSVLGRRDRLPSSLLAAVRAVELASGEERDLHLRLAIDYSGRAALLRAAQRAQDLPPLFADSFARLVTADAAVPDVDLLIRTGGERRLSDCPLWEIAYAELVFTETLWPDFGGADLESALKEFDSRDRRFGRILEPVAP
jgi:undecaprenyl diphosphate synthase